MNNRLNFPKGRVRLATVIQDAGKVIRTDDVEKSLNVSRPTASKLLSRWRSQGWLRRAGPGIYAVARMEYLDIEQVLDDPWMIIPSLYDPAYVGGRTACEHWGLTEQIFRDTVVITGQPVRAKYQKRFGLPFTLKHIRPNLIFGVEPVWYENIKVFVSDVHRTMLDILNDPPFGGGIRHVADCFAAYLRHEERQDETLISHATRLGNGAIFKRLGFLAERASDSDYIIDACRHNMTKGNAKLDPVASCPHLITRWRLLIPDYEWI